MKIYHNPRCSKSRETLKIISDHNIKPEICLYLENPLSVVEINNILDILKTSPNKIIRRNEEIFKKLNLKDASDEILIKSISKYPILLERPIVVEKNQAIIGRPPENVKELIKNIY